MSLAVEKAAGGKVVASRRHNADPQPDRVLQRGLSGLAYIVVPKLLGTPPAERQHLGPVRIVKGRLVDCRRDVFNSVIGEVDDDARRRRNPGDYLHIERKFLVSWGPPAVAVRSSSDGLLDHQRHGPSHPLTRMHEIGPFIAAA